MANCFNVTAHLASIFTCREPLERGILIGPLTSLPGQWNTLLADVTVLSPLEKVVAFVGQPVDVKGVPIGYPPLHVHHLHIRHPDFPSDAHWFETHGDYALGPTWGHGASSARGYVRRVPSNYCYVVPPTVLGGRDNIGHATTFTQINDVRFVRGLAMASGGNIGTRAHVEHASEQLAHASLEFYVHFGWTLAPSSAPCTPASKLQFWTPEPSTIIDDIYQRYAVPAVPAVSWWSGRMKLGGKLLSAWVHSHRVRFGDLMLFAASQRELDLGKLCNGNGNGNGNGTAPAMATGFAALPSDHEAVRRHLYPQRRRLVCASGLLPEDGHGVRVPAGHEQSAGIMEGWYDRSGSFECTEWSFRRGDHWTVVALHQPAWHQQIARVMQHSMIFAFFEEVGAESGVRLPRTAVARDHLLPMPERSVLHNPSLYVRHEAYDSERVPDLPRGAWGADLGLAGFNQCDGFEGCSEDEQRVLGCTPKCAVCRKATSKPP